jgi:ribose 5-phosphate isomerase B
MKIAFGCDHAGYEHREKIIGFLKSLGHSVTDMGSPERSGVDYPDFAAAVAQAVSSGKCQKGVLVCGTGVGMCITANKFPGVRAAVCWNDEVAALVSQHNDANIICLPGRFGSTEELNRWIGIWLKTPPSSEERHLARLKKIAELEKKLCARGKDK